MADARGQSSSTWNDAEAKKLPERLSNMNLNGTSSAEVKRKRVVVVGLGMVGIAFMYYCSISNRL
jgi:nitrite reductase (NAD(P)H)